MGYRLTPMSSIPDAAARWPGSRPGDLSRIPAQPRHTDGSAVQPPERTTDRTIEGAIPMKYLIQIYSNPESRAMWESFSAEEQAKGYAYYQGINDELTSSGELVASEALADISLAKRVTQSDGSAVASDGPFAETQELLAGVY